MQMLLQPSAGCTVPGALRSAPADGSVLGWRLCNGAVCNIAAQPAHLNEASKGVHADKAALQTLGAMESLISLAATVHLVQGIPKHLQKPTSACQLLKCVCSCPVAFVTTVPQVSSETSRITLSKSQKSSACSHSRLSLCACICTCTSGAAALSLAAASVQGSCMLPSRELQPICRCPSEQASPQS